MASASVYTASLPSYGPSSPTAQGSYGQTAQPNSTSTTGRTPSSTAPTAPPSGGTSSGQASPVNPDGTISAQMAQTTAAPAASQPAQTQQTGNWNTMASAYKQAFGTDATPDQMAWFMTQDPTAMLAHIQGTGTAQKAQPTGIVPTPGTANSPDYASIYQQAFGTAATPEQIAWFQTQDPTAMVAHITGMGAQQRNPTGTPTATIDPTALLTTPAPTYTPYNYTPYGQHTDPWAAQNTQAGTLLTNMLQNPHTITDQGAGILQERQKAQALAQQQALLDALQQQQVASGFGTPGGYQQSQQRRIGNDTNTQLLQGSQDLALARMKQNRQDEINALNAFSGFAGQDAARQGTLYQSLLSGQNAQSGDNFRGYASKADAFNNHQNTALSAQQLALQKLLGEGGLGLDARRLGESGRQFDLGHQLNWASLMEQMFSNRNNYGLNLAGLQQGAQNNMFSQLFGGG